MHRRESVLYRQLIDEAHTPVEAHRIFDATTLPDTQVMSRNA